MVSLIVLITLLCLPSVGYATTYYLDPTGSNSNNGTAEATPFLTFDKGISVLQAGDTLLIKDGDYETAGVRLSNGGTQTLPITIMAYPGHAPNISFTTQNAGVTFLLQRSPGHNLPIGWVTVDGLTFTGGYGAIRWYNCDHCTMRNLRIQDPLGSGIYGTGGNDNVITNSIIHLAGDSTIGGHGIYITGTHNVITRNIIYGSRNFGIQLRGNYDPNNTIDFPNASYGVNTDSVVSNNLFAYSENAAGLVIYGGNNDSVRIENNIFYENDQDGVTGINGIRCSSCSGSTGLLIRNNVAYATAPGGTTFIDSGLVEGVNYTQANNRVNAAVPGFVSAPSTYTASPDFTLLSTADAIGKALANEFPNNPTLASGPFATVGTPTCSITTNILTCTFPMNTAVPLQIPSATGVSITCTANPTACPGAPTVNTALLKSGTDSQAEVVISGIAGDACAVGQDWKISYTSATGAWTTFQNIGPYSGLHQKIFSFTDILATNLCTGSGPATSFPPGTPLIYYAFNDGAGPTATNTGSSGAADNCALTNGATWGTGHAGGGLVTTAGSTQYCAVPHLSGVNPTTQSMTWTIAINVPAGATSAQRLEVGPDIGTNQRGYICAMGGTWRLGVQSTTCTTASASNLAVDEGWNFLTLVWNSGTDVATLYKNGVAGTGGATKAYTSFTFVGDMTIGRMGANASPGGTYDSFTLYNSVEDPAALYAAWNAPVVAVGTFGQPAIRFQEVYLPSVGGSPTNLGTAINQAQNVVAGGAVAVLIQWYCENVADCEQDSVKLEARDNGAGSYQQVPDMLTTANLYMWGGDNDPLLNKGTTTARLTGSCTLTNGVTILTSGQVPVVDLQQDGCIVQRYLVRVNPSASGYSELRLSQQNGTAFAGTVNTARINVLTPQASSWP